MDRETGAKYKCRASTTLNGQRSTSTSRVLKTVSLFSLNISINNRSSYSSGIHEREQEKKLNGI